MAFLRWMFGLIIAGLLAVFAVSNRHEVDIYPSFLHDSFQFPLYLLVLGAMALSFLLGCLMIWFNVVGLRIEKHQYKKEIKSLKSRMSEEEASA